MRQTLDFGDHLLAAKRLLHGKSVSDPAIVLLHDALGCMATWKEFPQALFAATGLDLLMFDRRGHGESSPLPDELRTSAYLEEDARRLPEILDKLGVQRAILVGHSDGGSIALVAAALYPERVHSIVAIAAHVLLEEVTIEGVKNTVATAGETRLLERLAKYHGEKTEQLYRVWHETWLNPAHRDWNLLSYLPHIQCPVLVMQGELDEYGSIEQVKAIEQGVQTPSPSPFPVNGEGETEAGSESELPSSIHGGRVGDGGLKKNRWKSIPVVHWQYAREMRKAATEAEKTLWTSLSDSKLGVSFRRQHPIGPFIIDFFASSASLVIEVDGGAHLPDDAQEYDAQRDERLRSVGLTVLRLTNDDVMKRLDWVLGEIRKRIQTPSPGPFASLRSSTSPVNGEGVKRVRVVLFPGVGHAPQRERMGEVVKEIVSKVPS